MGRSNELSYSSVRSIVRLSGSNRLRTKAFVPSTIESRSRVSHVPIAAVPTKVVARKVIQREGRLLFMGLLT